MRTTALMLAFFVATGVGQAHAFTGDVGSWSGIPPLPPSASSMETDRASSYCTVADAVGHVEQAWMSNADCMRWIEAAKALSAMGPTAREVHEYRIRRCLERSASMRQQYSGQFYELCADAGWHPIVPSHR